MKVKLSFKAQSVGLDPTKVVGALPTGLVADREYTVVALVIYRESALAFIDCKDLPWPHPYDLRLLNIVDGTPGIGWVIGRSRMGYSQDIATIFGPAFWANDYHWYERLLDGDASARVDYAAYQQLIADAHVEPPGEDENWWAR